MKGLLPAENIAVTVALNQAARGEDTGPNVTAVLLMTIDRLRAEKSDEVVVGSSQT